MLRRVTEAVETGCREEIKSKTFWKDDEWDEIGVLDFESVIKSQSRELKKLGGRIDHSGVYDTWYPPKGSRIYRISFFRYSLRDSGMYFFLCLKDGRDLLLKLTAKRISIVDHLSPDSYRQMMIEFFLKLYGQDSCAEKTIKKFAKTGGYK